MENSYVGVVLAARQYWYTLFHGLFGGEPSRELVKALEDGVRNGLFDLYSCETGDAFDGMRSFASALAGDESRLGEISDEYTRLFVGPGHLDAPPWESPYVGKEGLLFQESTLKVRYEYAESGYLPQDYPRVADDHIALMMDYMAHMARRSAEAWCETTADDVGDLAAKQLRFIENHLLNWVPEYADRLEGAGISEFYALAARCALGFFEQDRGFLEQVVAKDLPLPDSVRTRAKC